MRTATKWVLGVGAIATVSLLAWSASASVPDVRVPSPHASEDTIRLARLLRSVEGAPGWKGMYQTEVAAWQMSRGMVADGKFGPSSAEEMALEVQELPLVRYWPKTFWQKGTAVADYKGRLQALAREFEEAGYSRSATKLRDSAAREAGQSWPKPAQPFASAIEQLAADTEDLAANYGNVEV